MSLFTGRHRKVLLVASAVGLVLIFVVLVLATSELYRIPASGMEPTLHCRQPVLGCEAERADRVLVWKLLYKVREPRRGDIVAFRPPPLARERCGSEGVRIKRIVALGGETWEERDGYVLIDGKKLSEPYAARTVDTRASYPPRRIPSGTYFLMGDNRGESCDSREWGAVTRASIIGPVVMTYWPPSRLSVR